MYRILAICLLLLAGPALATTLYKWVDENGVTHWSDKPSDGAAAVEIQSPQTFSAPPLPARSSDADSGDDETQNPYQMFEIAEPLADKTYWNLEGNLNVRLRVSPRLRVGHSIFMYVDGQRVNNLPTRQANFTLPEMWRGTHILTATIADRAGSVVTQSEPITFHIQQTSIQNPNNPNVPGRPTPTNPIARPNPGGG